MALTDEELDKLFRHPFFKPHFLKLNADILQIEPDVPISNEQLEMIIKVMRAIIFNTASDLKIAYKKMSEEALASFGHILPPQDEQLSKVIWRTYDIGVQNGIVDYANSLIEALEKTLSETKEEE